MFSNFWIKTKTATTKYIKIFIAVMVLNQFLFFGLCLNPVCLVAAMPHVLVITLLIGMYWGKTSNKVKDIATNKQSEIFDFKEFISKELSKYTEEQKSTLEELNIQNTDILTGVAHHNYLISSIERSKKQVIIMSGWLSSYVIDNNFLKLIETKLGEGVEIYIGYGFQDHKGVHNEFGNSKSVLKSLKRLIIKYPTSFFVASFATHEKLLIVDNLTVVIGSANWLSNRRYLNSERSFIITNNDFAILETKRAVTLIKANHIKGDTAKF